MATKKPCMRGHAGLMIHVFCQRLCDINLARDLNFLLYHPGQFDGEYAVLYLSCMKTGFPTDKMRQTVQYIKEHYGKMAITCDDYPHLLELMHHDKKNEGSAINFTLLADIGDLRINQTATEEEIKEALDFYREY